MPDVRPIAICLFSDAGRILVGRHFDSVKQSAFYRPIGGGIDFGEHAADAIVRETREELNAEIDPATLRRLDVIENLFTCNGAAGHEVVFVFDARFADRSLYARNPLPAVESNGEPFEAHFKRLDEFGDDDRRLVPEALAQRIPEWLDR